MRGAWLGVLGLLAACASAPPMWTPAARTSAVTCSAPDAPPTAGWQLVMGQGFTFCVPTGWVSSDGHTWRKAGSVLGWCSRDRIDQCPQVHGEVTAAVVSDPSQMTAAGIYNEGGACSSDRYSTTTSGTLAVLFDEYCNGHHMTHAAWDERGLLFFGETDDPETARLELQVYRTVRFVSSTRQ